MDSTANWQHTNGQVREVTTIIREGEQEDRLQTLINIGNTTNLYLAEMLGENHTDAD